MKIVIAGGSGFLGRALSDALRTAGHELVVLSRRRPQPGAEAMPAIVPWTPDGSAGAWASVIEGADVVVNLAGESIAAGRWSEARKRAILGSRVMATRSLVAAIEAATKPPRAFVSASAQGYYGDRGSGEVTEATPAGSDFLANVCARWETEALRAERSSRVVLLRTGLVLAASEGALPRMVLPFKAFGGGPVGTGRQYMAWIHWRDWADLVAWAIGNDRLAGPLNLSAPQPVTNADLSAAIGRALHRPSWLPAPAFALRVALGEMADALLLTSIRMLPARALQLGFRFQFEKIDAALHNLL